jgi:hypothetical protein
VADQFDHVFQMGQPDNARSCLSPGSRADLGDVGDGSAEDKNDSMASVPIVTAALGGRATWTFGELDLGNNEGSHGGSGVHCHCGGSGGGGSRK